MVVSVNTLVYEELDQSRVKRLHWKVGLFAGLGAFLDGFDYAVIAIALIGIVPALGPSPSEIAALVAAAYAGGAVGGVLFGNLADRFGRKLLFLLDIAFFIVFAALSGFAANVWWLIVLRFCLGIGLGGDFPLSASYMAEFAPTKFRGRLGSWVGSFWWVGALCAMLVGAAFYLVLTPVEAWRWILAFGSVPAVFALWLRAGLPESPRWYIIKGRPEKALEVIRRINPAVTEQQVQALAASIRSTSGGPPARVRELFTPQLISATIFTSGFFTCYTLAFYAVTIYGPTILKNLGGYTAPIQIALGTAFYFLWACIGAYSNVFAVEKIGRKTCLLVSFIGMAVILFVVAAIYPSTFLVGILLLAAFQFFQAFGPGALWASYIPELFPTRLRGTGHGMATFASRLGAVLSSFIWVWAAGAFGTNGAFVVHGAFAVVGVLLTVALGVETMGKALEEINREGEAPRPIGDADPIRSFAPGKPAL